MARFLAPAVFALLLFATVPAVALAEPSTPELIERAEARGQIDRHRADLLRAYALARPAQLPAEFRSGAPWDGTPILLELRRDLARTREAERGEIEALLATSGPGEDCGTEGKAQSNFVTTTHFYVTYQDVAGGLDAADYAASLEGSWEKEVSQFGWAAPPVLASAPPPGGRYHVRIDALAQGLYGFVTNFGDHAGVVGNNPSTAWNDIDASASCMVLNRDYSAFPSGPQAALDSTTAHEFNHSIQYGYGALAGANVPDDVFVEGGATWMEDEVHDAANDNYHYLWPVFSDSMGEYTASPYPYWITFRGFTERYGTGSAGGGEQVMQDFWERTSRNLDTNQAALAAALSARGTTLAEAFHAYAIAVKFNRPCGAGYPYPYCFEEASGYLAEAGGTPVHRMIGAVGGSTTGSVEDSYALSWVALPASGNAYDISLANTSGGGQLRGTVACDTGSGLALSPLPSVLASGQSQTLTGFSSAGCVARVLVVTNESQLTSSTARSFSVSTTPASGATHTLSVTRTGSGNGTVTSTPSGIDCGADCSQAYAADTPVTLAATPAPGSTFAGWSGACTGIGPCTVAMSTSRSVDASFTLLPDATPPETTITGGPGGPSGSAGDVVAPAISRLRLSPVMFRAARTGSAMSAVVGTRVSLAVSEAVTVTFRIRRLLTGGRVMRVRGRIVRKLPAGKSRLRFRGRLAGRTLRPGRYQLVARARDGAGNASPRRRAGFVILR